MAVAPRTAGHGRVVAVDELRGEASPGGGQLGQHLIEALASEIVAGGPQVRRVEAHADPCRPAGGHEGGQLGRRAAELVAGADRPLEEERRCTPSRRLEGLGHGVTAAANSISARGTDGRARVEHDASQAQRSGHLEFLGEHRHRPPAHGAVGAREVHEVGSVGEAPPGKARLLGEEAEAGDLVVPPHDPPPATGWTEEELQRLAAAPRGCLHGPSNTAGGGQVRAHERHPDMLHCRVVGARILRLVALLSGLCLGGVLAAWFVLWVGLRSTAVRVPDVRGMDKTRAVAVLQDSGLLATLQEDVFDTEVPVGRIARQRPGAGLEVKRGSVVRLFPSQGSEVRRVGTLVGLPLNLAEAELEGLGLRSGRRCRLEEQATAAVVVAHAPPAGATVAPGGAVDLLVNAIPRRTRYVMPDFVGVDEAVATRVIRALGFRLAARQAVHYPGARAGIVLRQDPEAGGPVTEAEVVALWVSQ